jgi:hypothetical protein
MARASPRSLRKPKARWQAGPVQRHRAVEQGEAGLVVVLKTRRALVEDADGVVGMLGIEGREAGRRVEAVVELPAQQQAAQALVAVRRVEGEQAGEFLALGLHLGMALAPARLHARLPVAGELVAQRLEACAEPGLGGADADEQGRQLGRVLAQGPQAVTQRGVGVLRHGQALQRAVQPAARVVGRGGLRRLGGPAQRQAGGRLGLVARAAGNAVHEALVPRAREVDALERMGRHRGADEVGLVLVGTGQHEGVGIEIRHIPAQRLARGRAHPAGPLAGDGLHGAPGPPQPVDEGAEAAVGAREVAVFMRNDGQRLVGRQGFEQRQAEQQIVARPAGQAEGRALHDGGVDVVGQQHMVEARAFHAPPHAVHGVEQRRRLAAAQFAPLRSRQAHEQRLHRRLQQQPQRDGQQDQQLAELQHQDEGLAAGREHRNARTHEQPQAQARQADDNRQQAEAQQGQQRHLGLVGGRALSISSRATMRSNVTLSMTPPLEAGGVSYMLRRYWPPTSNSALVI